MQRFVNASGLDLHASARDGAVITVLPCGHSVTVIADDRASGWVRIECADPRRASQRISGVVAETFLRPALTPAREALVAAALTEWKRFDYGAGREDAAPYAGFVGEMWSALGLSRFDGTHTQKPWSAAAISWVVRQAAGDIPELNRFAFSAGHWEYIKQAIQRRERNQPGPYWGRRLHEAKAQIGDMAVLERSSRPGRHNIKAIDTYEEARDTRRSFPSHCDLIIGVSGGQAHALGGNVGNSFKMTSFDLDDEGRLKAKNRVFMLLQCQL